VTSSRRAATAPALIPTYRHCEIAAALEAALLAGAALLGWLRVPRPLAPCPASPGGCGRAVIAQRRGTYLCRLCKAAGGGPGAVALTPQRPGMRGGDGGLSGEGAPPPAGKPAGPLWCGWGPETRPPTPATCQVCDVELVPRLV
jgi:hypothetical protein